MHTRLRRLVAKAFSPRSADRLRPFMREVVNDLVDNVASIGRADIAIDICEPYPIPIICELLGAPRRTGSCSPAGPRTCCGSSTEPCWTSSTSSSRHSPNSTSTPEGLIAARRNDPRDDLITDLIAAEEAGDRLTTDELVMMVNAVIVGGTDTTRNQLGCAVGLLSDHPDQWRLLADDPAIAPNAVEETMRYFGAVRGTGRFASEDIVYRDLLFPAGTFVFPSLSAANFDGGVFERPDTLDITREPVKQHPQMTFGSGHPLLPGGLAGPCRTPGGPPHPRPADARPPRRRRHRMEAADHRDLRPGPSAGHLHAWSLNSVCCERAAPRWSRRAIAGVMLNRRRPTGAAGHVSRRRAASSCRCVAAANLGSGGSPASGARRAARRGV